MTFYTLTRTDGPGPWDYPTLGFTAGNGAVLDGSLFDPPLTDPPDAFWAVGGAAESGVTRWGALISPPAPAEPATGSVLVYDAVSNASYWAAGDDVFAAGTELGDSIAATITTLGDELEATLSARTPTGLTPPLVGVDIAALPTGEVKPVDHFDGVTYGFGTGNIYKSTDGGASWTVVGALPSGGANLVGLRPTSNPGQVIAVCTEGVWLGSQFDTGSMSWSAKKITPNGTAAPQPFSFDGYGLKFIYAEYGPGASGFTDSRYAYVTTDGGVTWSLVWDSNSDAAASAPDESHLHGVCYDRWRDRFYLSEGHGPASGIYHSEDDGTTWALAPGMAADSSGPITAAPTSICATPTGLVLGGDSSREQGLYGVISNANPMVERMVRTWAWRTGKSGNNGWGLKSVYDSGSGLVWTVFRSQNAGVSPCLVVGSPTSGELVWSWPTPETKTINDTILSFAVDDQQRFMAYGFIGGSGYLARGRTGQPRSATRVDEGDVLGGVAGDNTSVAVGYGSTTADWLRSVAVGISSTSYQDGVAVGHLARVLAAEGTSVGTGSTALAAGTALGYNSYANASGAALGRGATAGSAGTAIGYGATGGTGVAVGYLSNAGGANSVALGASATTGADAGVAVGAGAATTAGSAVAVGRLAEAYLQGVALGHTAKALVGTASVALGQGTVTNASFQVQIGPRHFEMYEVASAPAVAPADGMRLYVRDNGSGKSQLVAQFASGAVQVIATQP